MWANSSRTAHNAEPAHHGTTVPAVVSADGFRLLVLIQSVQPPACGRRNAPSLLLRTALDQIDVKGIDLANSIPAFYLFRRVNKKLTVVGTSGWLVPFVICRAMHVISLQEKITLPNWIR